MLNEKLKKLSEKTGRIYDRVVYNYPIMGGICLSFMLPAFIVWATWQGIKCLKMKIPFSVSWLTLFTITTLTTMAGMSIHGVLVIAGVVA